MPMVPCQWSSINIFKEEYTLRMPVMIKCHVKHYQVGKGSIRLFWADFILV